MLQVSDCVGDGLEQVVQLTLKLVDFPVDYLFVHLSAGLLVDQVVVDVLFLRQPFHVESHFLLVDKLSDVHYVRVNVVPTELLF